MPLPSRDSQSLNALASEQPVNVGRPERLICLAAGGLLLATGAARRDAIGAAQSLAGVVLAARGTTGHWPLLHSIGLDTLRNRGDTDAIRVRKLLHVRRSFTIDRPADELFAFWRKL